VTANRQYPDLVSSTKRSRQVAAGLIRQALLNIEAKEPFGKKTEQMLWSDRQALETAFSALTDPKPSVEPPKPRKELRTLEEELGLYD
jgi:hypothetical protein